MRKTQEQTRATTEKGQEAKRRPTRAERMTEKSTDAEDRANQAIYRRYVMQAHCSQEKKDTRPQIGRYVLQEKNWQRVLAK